MPGPTTALAPSERTWFPFEDPPVCQMTTHVTVHADREREGRAAHGRSVCVGSHVRVRDIEGEEEYTIVDTGEADHAYRLISVDCPLGGALLGRRVGESVQVRTPGGRRAVTILSVS